MTRYLAKRAWQGLLVTGLAAALTFFLVKLAPGDPFAAALDNPGVTAQIREQWRANWGLDRPAPEQFVRWVAHAARGDLGYSFSQRRPVSTAIAAALPYSLVLGGAALALSIVFGVSIALVQASRRNSGIDRLLHWATLGAAAAPESWIALLLLATFTVSWRAFPVGGAADTFAPASVTGRAADLLYHLVLPALSLAIVGAAVVARHQRAALISVMPEPFVRAARARGIPEATIWRRHILRNALGPLLTLIGLALPVLAGGAVFVEWVFAWPGMGLLAARAVSSRDAPLVTACVLLVSVLVVLGGIVTDLLHAWVDPRVRITTDHP